MFRLRYTSVSGFPRCGSITACHALRSIPPSSNPACGFPALGFPGNCRSGHLQGVGRLEQSQRHQPQTYKVLVHRSPFRWSKGPLTPPFKMRYQTQLQEAVDLPKCLPRVSIVEVIPPSGKMATDILHHQGQPHMTPTSRGQLAELIPFPGKRFLRREHVQVSLLPVPVQTTVKTKREPQKVQGLSNLLKPNDSGLLPIDLQIHPGFQLLLNPPNQPLTLISSQDNKIITVAHQPSTRPVGWSIRPVKRSIEPVQVDIGQQRRNYSPNAKGNFEFVKVLRYRQGRK
jgi:hypothetical protein